MAAPYKKTTIKTLPKIGEKITRDTLYWKHLEFPVTKKEAGAVTHVEFCPTAPYHYAVTSSTRCQIHSPHNHDVVKNFSRFREVAYSGSYRGDGRLLVAGGDEGVVRMFDVSNKTLLRNFRGHTGPVHVTRFLHDDARVMSASDDHTVRVWDVPSQAETAKFTDSGDYIRCGATSQASKDMIVTGCYDHRVRLYDVRTSTAVMSVDHGAPVESVVMYPSGGVVVSAGGNTIKVWDILSGGRIMTTLSHHHKTIMSLCLATNNSRLVSASLDRHVKMYDVASYDVVHTLDYPSAILSVAVAPDDSLLAVGMADGLLSVQRRRDTAEVAAEKQQQQKEKKSSYKYRLLRNTHTPAKGDIVVDHTKKPVLAPYDKFLKKFEHSRALDAAMDLRLRARSPEVTISVMQELMRRDALQSALAGRDEKSLTAILKFLHKNLTNPNFTEVLIEVVNIVLDLYTCERSESPAVDEMLVRVKELVDQELGYMGVVMETLGALDALMAASHVTTATTPGGTTATTGHGLHEIQAAS